jgi:hypothetical protein
MAARIILMHGNDSVKSLQQLAAWKQQFITKYPTADIQYISSPTAATAQAAFSGVVLGGSLFATQQLVVIQRPTANEKGNARSVTSALCVWLSSMVTAVADMGVTIIVWDDVLLSEMHPLRQWFVAREAAGIARIITSIAATSRTYIERLEQVLGERGIVFAPKTALAIDHLLQQSEKQQRLQLRLKSQDQLPRDERPWIMQQLIAQLPLMLQTGEVVIQPHHIKDLAAATQGQASIFEVANAIRDQRWEQAMTYLRTWQDSDDMSVVLALLAALSRGATGQRKLVTLLADVELVVKNSLLPPVWAVMLMVQQLSQGNAFLVRDRALWLAGVAR